MLVSTCTTLSYMLVALFLNNRSTKSGIIICLPFIIFLIKILSQYYKKMGYENIYEIFAKFSDHYNNDNIIVMTDNVVKYEHAEMTYSHELGFNKAIFPKYNERLKTFKIHIAHEKVRYNRINDLSKRMKPGPYATHHIAAGDPSLMGILRSIPYVIWLPEFYTPMNVCIDSSKVYVYLTPNGKWYYYIHKN